MTNFSTTEKVIIGSAAVLLYVSSILIPVAYTQHMIKWLITAVTSGYVGG